MENRSFFYFQTHTLPKWTEFFDSDLWSQKIMQLSHVEPAIKHGILALSTMHERFESTTPIFTSKSNDFAFVQYMQAVKHSNELLRAHSQGRVDVEKVLIACIIFTCYENLAGNYRAANMHLRNGLLILNQHKRGVAPEVQTASQESIGNVLYRFDLQAMTFSDNTSPYDYGFDNPPDCPQIPDVYTKNSTARNDLVGLMRCMMWVSGIANINPNATDNPIWLRLYTQVVTSFDPWERAFDLYQKSMAPYEQGDPKVYAGNTLLKMSFIMTRIIIGAGHRIKNGIGLGYVQQLIQNNCGSSRDTANPYSKRTTTFARIFNASIACSNTTAVNIKTSLNCPEPGDANYTITPRPFEHSLLRRPFAINTTRYESIRIYFTIYIKAKTSFIFAFL
ncbi:hypothetical protein N0V90_000679 [Kalmusia sp. IMI 367209]|nr:hypothetical protein N0V90_000679 [Kalmusia sp. IMI 367209]